MKQLGSVTTTILSKAVSAIGTPHGEHGLATRENSARVAEWLAKQTPEDMDKAAVSRALSHGAHLRVKYEGRYPVGPDGERMPSYLVAVGCHANGEPGAFSAAAADLRNFLTPAPMRMIEQWLARLSVVVAKRKDDAFSEELRVVEYASRMSQYPADVVRHVLLSKTYKFWPTWDELHKLCDAMTSPRRAMIATLERGPAPLEPEMRPPTQGERARIAALVDEMFPAMSQDMRDAAVSEALNGDCFAGPVQ